jgi:hypothetical protein
MGEDQGKSPAFVAGLDYFKNLNKVVELIVLYEDSEAYDKWLNKLETYYHLTAPYMKKVHDDELAVLFAAARTALINLYKIGEKRQMNPLIVMTTFRPKVTELQKKLFLYSQPAINKFSGGGDTDFNEEDFLEHIS